MATGSQSRKHRGYRTQKVFAEYIRPTFPYAEPTGAGRQGSDILGTPGIHWELKARTGFNPSAALKQVAEGKADDELGLVVLRLNGQGEQSIGKWVALTDVDTMMRLLKEAGYGTA
jgi:hypothetical protein